MYMYMTDCVYYTVVVGSCVHSRFLCSVQIVKICTFYGLNGFQKVVLLRTGLQQTRACCAVTCLVLIMQYAHTPLYKRIHRRVLLQDVVCPQRILAPQCH